MKLIHVFSVFGTAESFFDGQFKYLTDKGYEIVVVSSDALNTVAFCKRNGVRFVPVNIPRSVSPNAIVKAVIPYYYSILDVFVFPSHREGFGMCVVEASAMEKPILDSRAHGCVDAIVEHETGEYIEISAEGICKGMEQMLDADLRGKFGMNGRKRVLEWYDFKVMWPLVGDLYKKLLR